MSELITKCPKCETTFNVPHELLTVAKGKVRCGHCRHVFNASMYQVGGTVPTVAKPAEPEPVEQGGKFQFDQNEIDGSTAEGFITKLEMPAINTFGEMRAVKDDDVQHTVNEDAIADTQSVQLIDIPDDGSSADRFNTTYVDEVTGELLSKKDEADEDWIQDLLKDDD